MTPEPDAIVRQEDCGRAALRALRVSREGPTTTVFRDDRRDWYIPTRPPTAADIMLRPPTAVYTVDTAEHPERFEVELPSKEEAFFFRAEVAVVWQVRDAIAAVTTGLSHSDETYRPLIDGVLRRVARKYPIEHSADAERAMNDEFLVPLRASQGVFVTRCTVKLSLDEETQKHVASRTLAKRRAETRDLEHEATQQDGTLRQQEALLSHELERLTAEHGQELAEMAEKHERQLLKERMAFYEGALAGGHFNLIALKLADRNEDVDDVIGLIMRQRNLDFEGARGMLTSMIEEGLVNRSQVQDILARINTVMHDHLTKPAFTIASQGAAPLPGKDEPITIDASVEDGKATPHQAEDEGAARADEDEEDDESEDDEDELP